MTKSRFAFVGTVRKFCKEIGWQLDHIERGYARIVFTEGVEVTQTVHISWFAKASLIEFSVPSAARFQRVVDMPGELSRELLRRSAERSLGFWTIGGNDGVECYYSLMHNLRPAYLTVELFRDVINSLLIDCDEFDKAWLQNVVVPESDQSMEENVSEVQLQESSHGFEKSFLRGAGETLGRAAVMGILAILEGLTDIDF